MRRPVMDSRLLARIDTAVFTSRLTIQRDSGGAANSFGEIPQTWGNVAGLASIPCSIAPAAASERRGSVAVVTEATHTALLSTYLPQITSAMRALVDNQPYDIVAVEHDSRRAMTRVQLKVVTT
jgi:head-tail adaptor